MEANFSPSVNIVRDSGRAFSYIPTNNSRGIYQQIASNFKTGVHSFNVIGSYGTGKSAFLLAFKKHLSGEKSYFPPVNGQFNGCKKFNFLNIIGYAGSFLEALAKEFDVEPKEKDVFKALESYYKGIGSTGGCLVILVDEFGKFLEHAVENDPDKELYFIQQLAEFANDPERNILFLSTLHQNFDAYASGLKETQRKEWEKVKGRLKELTFNEPVEQLLNLATEYIQELGLKNRVSFDRELLELINQTGTFNLLNNTSNEFVDGLYPFDLLSAMALTLGLQRYGQNERSLFNFLQTEEEFGLNQYLSQGAAGYYNLANVYDYFKFNYYSTLTSRFNPDYIKWFLLRNSLERVELEFSEDVGDIQKLVKTIGLLDIFGSEAAKVSADLLERYAEKCLEIPNAARLINRLEDKKIIRYQSFKNRYRLFEGTDLDIEGILAKAREEIGQIGNLPLELKPYFKSQYIQAKAVTLKKGTPRFFKYEITEEPILSFPYGDAEYDGIVNLLFEPSPKVLEAKNEPIIYGVFSNSKVLYEGIQEIKAIDKAFSKVGEDKVARAELFELKHSQVEALNQMLNDQLFGWESKVNWYLGGKEVPVHTKRALNRTISDAIEKIFKGTPTFKNELVNKNKVSSSVHFAKKQYIEALIENWNKPNLGFEDHLMPPEKTIYFSLLNRTGIHRDVTLLTADFFEPEDKSYSLLWQASLKFLDSAKLSKRNLKEFIDTLSQRPFKLKDGFIEFWLISFLFIKREEFALFKDGRYIPRFTKEVAELLMREAKSFEIKSFNIEGVKLDLFNKYRELTQQDKHIVVTGSGFQETARPFLVFFKKLPAYTQKTKNLSHDALAFREVIENAKELEKTFFEDLPTSFGVSVEHLAQSQATLDSFVSKINTSITELRSAYDDLVDRVEKELIGIVGLPVGTEFESYQTKIGARYALIKDHLLFPRQKALYSRLQSKLPDRKAWLNSIVQAVLGKQLEDLSDQEEAVLYGRLQDAFQELDNLVELSAIQFKDGTEEALRIEISGFNSQVLKQNVILSKEQSKEVAELEKRLKKLLGDSKNKQVSQAVLIKALREMLSDDKG